MARSIVVALLRHAATAWTAERRVQGRADVPLSPEGRRQVATWRLPSDLAAPDVGRVTSPLTRAVETARALGAGSVRLEPRLAERDYGGWTGLGLDDLARRWSEAGWETRAPGGESAADVLARARAWLDDTARNPGPGLWVAVTHRGVIQALLAATIGWDLRDPAPFRFLPERIHRLRRRGDGHLQLLTLNEPLRTDDAPAGGL